MQFVFADDFIFSVSFFCLFFCHFKKLKKKSSVFLTGAENEHCKEINNNPHKLWPITIISSHKDGRFPKQLMITADVN